MAKKPLTIQLEPATLAKLEAQANSELRSRSNYASKLVEIGVANAKPVTIAAIKKEQATNANRMAKR